jgi:ATP-binding cassette subfamily B protein
MEHPNGQAPGTGAETTANAAVTLSQWRAALALFPYVWRHRGRVITAFILLVAAKLATVSVPLILKEIVDDLQNPNRLAAPLALVVAYGVLRFANTACTELRDGLFARVLQRAMRGVIHDVFRHLHALSLRFHLNRRTGALAAEIERGARSIRFLINFSLFNIGPTLLEIALVAGILFVKYDPAFGLITLFTLAVYISFTLLVTNWRLEHRRAMHAADARANAHAVDSLLNFETVKVFGNEIFEAERLKTALSEAENAAVRTEASLAWLNTGQALIISASLIAMMSLAVDGVAAGRMTLGDLVLVNAFLIQLFIPLNFLGTVYREIRNALTDMEKLFGLLYSVPDIRDQPDAPALAVAAGEVRFEAVRFAYDPRRPILADISFTIPAGHKVAVVGASGSGKSTLARLLFRFYEVDSGRILIDGQDLRTVTQASLRAALGMVPQDTVLFNDTLYYNIAYGRPEADRAAVIEAGRAARLDAFVASLPEGWETRVGERGLKLSGGEKQRVAIARALLKNPPILVFDEATSSLDSVTEQAIQSEIELAAKNRSSLVIAHRLSTVIDADEILVLEEGRIVERGNHASLLAKNGPYAELWRLQLRNQSRPATDPTATVSGNG